MNVINIRIATIGDRSDIQRIYLCAFPLSEDKLVSKLSTDLLSEISTPETISLVAESDSCMVGHVAFSPVKFDGNINILGYILAPLGVKPEYQRRSIGTKLIKHGIQQLSSMGVNFVFVYGDPKYYGRFGFSAEAARQFITPFKLQYPFGWQALVLVECKNDIAPVKVSCVNSLYNPELW